MGSIGRWVWRHKRAIAIGTVGAASCYAAYTIWRKKRELEDLLDSLGLDGLLSGASAAGSKASREARVREHFAATQREADRLLIEDALPRVERQIASLLDTDEFKQRMKAEGRMKDPSAWNELMVLTVARSLTTQYALALVTLHLRIKLNIVSRHYLLEIAEATDGPSSLGHLGGAAKLSDLTKRRFLSMDHLLNEGLQPLALAVTDVVRAQLAPVNSLQRLTEKLNAEQSLALLAASRAALEERLLLGADDEAAEWEAASAQAVEASASRRSASGASSGNDSSSRAGGGGCGDGGGGGSRTNGHGSNAAGGAGGAGSKGADDVLGSYLLHEMRSHGRVAHGDQLHRLLAEVSEVLRSAAFRLTLSDLVKAAFDTLGTELALAIQRESGAPEEELTGGAIPLAKLFAQLHRCSQGTFSQPSPFAEALLVTPALDELCWMAYSGEVSDGAA